MYQSSRLNDKHAFPGNKESIFFPYFSFLSTHRGMCVYGHYVPELIFLHNDFRRYRKRLVLRYAFYFQSYRSKRLTITDVEYDKEKLLMIKLLRCPKDSDHVLVAQVRDPFQSNLQWRILREILKMYARGEELRKVIAPMAAQSGSLIF